MENTNLYKGIVFFLIIVIVIFVINSKNTSDGWEEVIKVIEKDEYYGKVTGKFIDKKNHNTPIIVLSTNKQISLYGHQWDKIMIGDSLSKKLHTTTIEVFKKNQMLEIDQKKYIESLKNKQK